MSIISDPSASKRFSYEKDMLRDWFRKHCVELRARRARALKRVRGRQMRLCHSSCSSLSERMKSGAGRSRFSAA